VACKFCDRVDAYGTCYEHCQESVDGTHVPDWRTVSRDADAPNGVVDVCCRQCGQSGAVTLTDDMVEWE
jgi:hypothetical protein